MLVQQQAPVDQEAPVAPEVQRENDRENVLGVNRNPYAQDLSDEDDENREFTDTRIFQFEETINDRYPMFLRRSDEVKAANGFVWCRQDAENANNMEKCSYVSPVPTRGNCVMCGRSGALGSECSNRCRYNKMTSCVIRRNARNRHDDYRDDPDLDIRRNARSRYRIMLTPEKENMIDAEFFAEMMYKGVDDDQKNWKFFNRASSSFKARKHDNVLARLERKEDPWLYTFPLDHDCEWFIQLDFLASSQGLKLEEPLPNQVYRLD